MPLLTSSFSGDMFGLPPSDDEDDALFSGRSGLFSGGRGLFDDADDADNADQVFKGTPSCQTTWVTAPSFALSIELFLLLKKQQL